MWTRAGFAAIAFITGAVTLSAMGPVGADPDRCSAVTNLCTDAATVDPALPPELDLGSREIAIAAGDYLETDFRVIREPERHNLEPAPYGFFYAKVGETVWLVNSDTRQIARREL